MTHTSVKRLFLQGLILTLTSLFFTGCASMQKEPLSLWTGNAPAKEALLAYMQDITNPNSVNFIPVKDRVAIFDLDGTLMLETNPTYFDWLLFEYRVLEDPTYQATPAQLKAARLAREQGIFPPLTMEREQMVAEAYKGLTLDEFYNLVRTFMQQDQPGFIGMKRGDIFYRPMVEVVNYLLANKFTVYISSGTERLTIRPLIEQNLPAIPLKQVIGSDSLIVTRAQADADNLSHVFIKGDELIMGGKILVKNLHMNKVVTIVREIGQQPVLAFGNSITDASMLNYTLNNNKYKALGFMLCNDDLEREYGNMQKAEKMRENCEKYGWICVSMHNDWKTIYGPHIQRR